MGGGPTPADPDAGQAREKAGEECARHPLRAMARHVGLGTSTETSNRPRLRTIELFSIISKALSAAFWSRLAPKRAMY